MIGTRRDRAERYLFLTIVAFAVTVVAVRVYLNAAGYPQIGGGELHVAHMLWGGLLLVVAAILVQLFVGRRSLMLSAVAAGAGVGLFIDEVGKFITASNDYFFAPAAPIIYGAVLLLVLLWVVVRRDRTPTRAEATHAALGAMGDLADGGLTDDDRQRVVAMLRASGAANDPGLPATLLSSLLSPASEAMLVRPGWVARGSAERWLRRLLPDLLERNLIRLGLLLSVLEGFVGLLYSAAVLAGENNLLPAPSGPIELPQEPIWVFLVGAVFAVVGAANLIALVLSLVRRHAPAMNIARYAILMALAAGGLLNVYASQLGALSDVVFDVVMLLLVLDQQRRLAAKVSTAPA